MLKVKIVIDIPDDYYEKAKYIFELFSLCWGLSVCFSRNTALASSCDILYAKPSGISAASLQCICIQFDDALYSDCIPCQLTATGDDFVWSREHESDIIDIIASTYRIIMHVDENEVKQEHRDRRKIFKTPYLPAHRQAHLSTPIVELHAQYLLNMLTARNKALKDNAIPRWPEGKKYALSITHDTDAVDLGSTKELLTNLAKFLLRRDSCFSRMFKDGMKCRGNLLENPLFGFTGWEAYEKLHGIRSCFYLPTKQLSAIMDINDVKSTLFDSNFDFSCLKKMYREGWEFGYHPSIHSKSSIDEFIYGKKLIEDQLEAPIYGVRHHYLALDWERPYLTFRKHVNAGFKYDTSIAWRDRPGFRAGTCLPYKPFDPIRDKALDMYELPTCLMDVHIINKERSLSAILRDGMNIIDTVKQHGGMAIINWHTESYCNTYRYEEHFDILKHMMTAILTDDAPWIATPWDIAKWWHKRSLKLRSSHEDW